MRAPIRIHAPDENARRLHCAEQSFCLGIAASLDWAGMSCAECPGYKEMTMTEYRKDMEGFEGLWRAIVELGWMGESR